MRGKTPFSSRASARLFAARPLGLRRGQRAPLSLALVLGAATPRYGNGVRAEHSSEHCGVAALQLLGGGVGVGRAHEATAHELLAVHEAGHRMAAPGAAARVQRRAHVALCVFAVGRGHAVSISGRRFLPLPAGCPLSCSCLHGLARRRGAGGGEERLGGARAAGGRRHRAGARGASGAPPALGVENQVPTPGGKERSRLPTWLRPKAISAAEQLQLSPHAARGARACARPGLLPPPRSSGIRACGRAAGGRRARVTAGGASCSVLRGALAEGLRLCGRVAVRRSVAAGDARSWRTQAAAHCARVQPLHSGLRAAARLAQLVLSAVSPAPRSALLPLVG